MVYTEVDIADRGSKTDDGGLQLDAGQWISPTGFTIGREMSTIVSASISRRSSLSANLKRCTESCAVQIWSLTLWRNLKWSE